MHELNKLGVGEYIWFVRHRPGVVGHYMMIIRLQPNIYFMARNDNEIALYPTEILRRRLAGTNFSQIVQRHRVMTRAEVLGFIPFINRNYTIMHNVPRSANRRARIN